MICIKRFAAILFSGCLLFALLTACSGRETASEGKEPEEKVLDGYTLTVLQGYDSTDYLFYYSTDTPIGDKIRKHIEKVEEQTGCTIGFLGGTGDTALATQVTASVGAGNHIAEVLRMHGNNCLMTFARAGLLTPMSEFPDTIDYLHSVKYGYPAQLEAAMVSNEAYAICPTFWPMEELEVYSQVIVFNNGILQKLALPDLREIKENGKWYWDLFLETITEATHDEGGRTVKGFCCLQDYVTSLAMLSNGVRFVTLEGDSLGTDIYSSKCVQAIDFVQTLYRDYSDCIMTYSTGSVWKIDDFLNEDCVLQLVQGQYVSGGSLQYESRIDFGILPFPCGPEGSYGKWAHVIGAIFGFSIPVTADLPDYAAVALDSLFEPIEDYAELSKEEYYALNVFRDPRDAKTYAEVASGGRYSYWPEGGTAFISRISSNLSSKSAAALLETYGPSYETVIEEYMMPNYEFISEYILK